MADVTISQFKELTSPELRAHAQKIADAIIAAGCKAAAHHGDAAKYPLPEGESLEKAFLGYLRGRPAERQKLVVDRCLPLVRDRKLRGFAGLDVAGAKRVREVALAGAKLAPLTKTTDLVNKVAPVLVEGKPGFRMQAAIDRLQFRLTRVTCVDETDGFAGSEAGSDEIAVGGLMVDAAGTTVQIPQVQVGAGFEDGVTRAVDRLLGEVDFRSGTGWPKTFQLVLILVEIDNGGFPTFLDKLLTDVRQEITETLISVGTDLAGPIGAAIGAAIGAIVSLVFDLVFGWIKEIWEDDYFKPCTMEFKFNSADDRWAGRPETDPLAINWWGHGGQYQVWFQARLVLESAISRQENWRWCSKCAVLHFGGNTPGRCPAGGGHVTTGSGNYALAHNSPSALGQSNWRYCNNCEALHFGGNTPGRCPAGGGHITAGSGDYTLRLEDASAPGQANWRYCSKCEGLFFAGNGAGVCPAGGGHSANLSGNYTLLIR